VRRVRAVARLSPGAEIQPRLAVHRAVAKVLEGVVPFSSGSSPAMQPCLSIRDDRAGRLAWPPSACPIRHAPLAGRAWLMPCCTGMALLMARASREHQRDRQPRREQRRGVASELAASATRREHERPKQQIGRGDGGDQAQPVLRACRHRQRPPRTAPAPAAGRPARGDPRSHKPALRPRHHRRRDRASGLALGSRTDRAAARSAAAAPDR